MAVAFDHSNTSSQPSTFTTYTESFTMGTGANGKFYAFLFTGNTGDFVTSVTYGGMAMTRTVFYQPSAGNNFHLWELVNPPTGANNLVIVWNNKYIETTLCLVSYVGALQSLTSNFATNIATPDPADYTASLTTLTNNSFAVMSVISNVTLTFPASNQRIGTSTDGMGVFDSGAISPSTYTFTSALSPGSGDAVKSIIIEVAPAGGGGGTVFTDQRVGMGF